MAFAPVSCAAWFGWHFNANAWRESQARKAKDHNLQRVLHLKETLKDKLNQIGFNSIVCNGCCFITSKIYPNLFTSFYFSEKEQPGIITWKYYISENHWYSIVISFTDFLDMTGEIGVSTEDKYGRLVFNKEPKRNFTERNFNQLVEKMINVDNIDAVPLQLHVEDVSGNMYHLDKDYFKGKIQQ